MKRIFNLIIIFFGISPCCRESITKAYIDIANSLGVTATDSGKHGGNIQLIIQEKLKGEMCK